MNCPNCNNQILEGTTVCPYCGANINQTGVSTQNVVEPVSNITTEPKNNKTKKIIIIIVAIIVLAVVGFVVYKLVTPSSSNNDNKKQEVEEKEEKKEETKEPETISYTPSDEDKEFLNPKMSETDPFKMAINNNWHTSGKGYYTMGVISSGTVKVNDEVQIIGLDHEPINTTVLEIKMFNKELESAKVGDSVGLLLKDVEIEDVEKGLVIIKPDSLTAHKKFEAKLDMLSTSEGGRSSDFYDKYRPQFYFYTSEITGEVTLNDIDKVSPGTKNNNITVELTKDMAMEEGTTFILIEGGKKVGSGTVTKVY